MKLKVPRSQQERCPLFAFSLNEDCQAIHNLSDTAKAVLGRSFNARFMAARIREGFRACGPVAALEDGA